MKIAKNKELEFSQTPPVGNKGANIFLVDDLRSFKPRILAGLEDDSYVRVCRTSKSAIETLESEDRHWDQFWFDHDLGIVDGVEDTTMAVVNYLIERHQQGRPLKVTNYIIHSSNGPGVRNIAMALSSIDEDSVIVNAQDFFFVVENS